VTGRAGEGRHEAQAVVATGVFKHDPQAHEGLAGAPIVVAEVEGFHHAGQVVVRFADDHQETVKLGGFELLKLPAVGERLTAYQRQTPEGPDLIGLRRGDEIVWELT
jgi:hypothetical protein